MATGDASRELPPITSRASCRPPVGRPAGRRDRRESTPDMRAGDAPGARRRPGATPLRLSPGVCAPGLHALLSLGHRGATRTLSIHEDPDYSWVHALQL